MKDDAPGIVELGCMSEKCLTPKEIAEQVVETSRTKADLSMPAMVVLGMLAGAYIAFGAQLCTMVTHDLAPRVGMGLSKFMGGSVFSVGLMLVVIGGAELFTGNCLMLMGILARKFTWSATLRNWTIVYLANFAGSLLVVAIVYGAGQWKISDGMVGAAALNTAQMKIGLTFSEAFWRGVACNWLVCLAVWLALASRDTAGKILGIYFPIMAFVASGFEHSIANMYFVPMGLLLKANPTVVAASGLSGETWKLTWQAFLANNLLPVTLGNIVGGALFVGGVYYLAYLRERKAQ